MRLQTIYSIPTNKFKNLHSCLLNSLEAYYLWQHDPSGSCPRVDTWKECSSPSKCADPSGTSPASEESDHHECWSRQSEWRAIQLRWAYQSSFDK